jgi:Ca2+-binding EF-hand superfamily protein
MLFKYFDVYGSGQISYDEFIRAIRGPMNQARKRMVAQAFDKLDKDGNGWIDINDVRGVYKANKHPDVISGKKTED